MFQSIYWIHNSWVFMKVNVVDQNKLNWIVPKAAELYTWIFGVYVKTKSTGLNHKLFCYFWRKKFISTKTHFVLVGVLTLSLFLVSP